LTGKVNELYDYDEEYDDNEDHYEPPAKKSKSDENNNTTQGVSKGSEQCGEVSRFATMSKVLHHNHTIHLPCQSNYSVCHLVFSDYLVWTSKYSKAHCYLHYQCFFPEFFLPETGRKDRFTVIPRG
jgi:hypothetical protein